MKIFLYVILIKIYQLSILLNEPRLLNQEIPQDFIGIRMKKIYKVNQVFKVQFNKKISKQQVEPQNEKDTTVKIKNSPIDNSKIKTNKINLKEDLTEKETPENKDQKKDELKTEEYLKVQEEKIAPSEKEIKKQSSEATDLKIIPSKEPAKKKQIQNSVEKDEIVPIQSQIKQNNQTADKQYIDEDLKAIEKNSEKKGEQRQSSQKQKTSKIEEFAKVHQGETLTTNKQIKNNTEHPEQKKLEESILSKNKSVSPKKASLLKTFIFTSIILICSW